MASPLSSWLNHYHYDLIFITMTSSWSWSYNYHHDLVIMTSFSSWPHRYYHDIIMTSSLSSWHHYYHTLIIIMTSSWHQHHHHDIIITTSSLSSWPQVVRARTPPRPAPARPATGTGGTRASSQPLTTRELIAAVVFLVLSGQKIGVG